MKGGLFRCCVVLISGKVVFLPNSSSGIIFCMLTTANWLAEFYIKSGNKTTVLLCPGYTNTYRENQIIAIVYNTVIRPNTAQRFVTLL